MKPETANLLELADAHLATARNIQRIEGHAAAARESYTTALAAARAVVFEERILAPKLHQGAHSLFHEIAVCTGRIVANVADVLASGIEIKIKVDYEPHPPFRAAQYAEYVDRAAEFVAAVKKLIEEKR